jgi:poly(A) polymerase Pap1
MPVSCRKIQGNFEKYDFFFRQNIELTVLHMGKCEE